MENNCEKTKIKELSEFQKILNSLRCETSTLTEICDRTFYFCSNLKEFPATIQEQNYEEKEPQGVVEMLWVEIAKIKKANEDLQRIVEHLERVIGS